MFTRFAKKISTIGQRLRKSSSCAIAYRLLSDALAIGLFGFTGLLTIKLILPSVLSSRIDLTIPFLVLAFVFLSIVTIARTLDISFPTIPDQKSILLRLDIIWGVALIILASLHFSIPVIAIITISLIVIGRIFVSYL